MPLKNPIEIPKIPKARKKKIESVINQKIVDKKNDKVEYNISASFRVNDEEKNMNTYFSIETVNEFSSFAYELSIDYLIKRNEIHILLLGLKAKSKAVPFIQPARAEIKIPALTGEYKVNIYKQDGVVNSALFYLNIVKQEIILRNTSVAEKENNRVFCNFFVDSDNFVLE